MPDPMATKVYLADRVSGSPALTLFLVPEPRVPGGSMLHLLEQAPLTGRIPHPNATLVDWLQVHSMPAIRTRFLAFRPGIHDPSRVRAILRDHFIADPAPMGLDLDDSEEITRLELLPEHTLGPRRIDDFHDEAVRSAMLAVYRHFEVDRRIPLMYHGFAEPEDGWFEPLAAEA
ncbi:hypothetical protein GFY24_03730 [Nocardia sp. SYP-A9097]|uniref:hypothetical protein n=1 Tax=Nocardia sp. SYP-A9097 TaxID=2663237 RepID=UPI00129B81A9|nr:hypothetical protein [Nocardia sp. SYP-A9097]MRH86589.1 hypothetical protein [Nocardia sp. SYP-A9097]